MRIGFSSIDYLLCFLLSLILSLTLTPLVRLIGIRSRRLGKASEDRWSKKHVSKGGGIAIFFGFILSVCIFTPLNSMSLSIIAGFIIIFVLGLIDDFVNIKPQVKLIGQLIAASIVVLAGVNVGFLNNAFGSFSYIIIIIWIVMFISCKLPGTQTKYRYHKSTS